MKDLHQFMKKLGDNMEKSASKKEKEQLNSAKKEGQQPPRGTKGFENISPGP